MLTCLLYFDIGSFLTLEYLKENKEILINYYQKHKVQSLLIYFLFYIFMTTLSFPGATILTLAGAATFGFSISLIVISFASSIGATLAFLISRYLFKDYIQKKFSQQLKVINKGLDQEGAFYLFSLRLIPIFPFFLINLLMGLTSINAVSYYFVSQIGMLLGTIVYVNAGAQLSQINSLKEIMSPQVIASFILLGLLPLFAKKIILFIKSNFLSPKV